MTSQHSTTPANVPTGALPLIIKSLELLAARVAVEPTIGHATDVVRAIASELAIVDDCVATTGDEAVEFLRRAVTGQNLWAPITEGARS